MMKKLVRSVLKSTGLHDRFFGSSGNAYSDFDEADWELIRRVSPFTMTSKERIFALRSAVDYVCENKIPGSVVECGVWRGGSMMVVAMTLLRRNDSGRELYLFDTFEGMPPPTGEDRRFDGVAAEAILNTREKSKEDPYWAFSPLDDVKQNVATAGYPMDRVHFVKGMVEETIPEHAPSQIALLRLDTDWYESTRHELVHLYDRVVPGGIIIIDDYGWYTGARKAVDEFLLTLPFKPLMNRIDRTGRLIVKPS